MSTSNPSVNTTLAPPAQPHIDDHGSNTPKKQTDPEYPTILIYADGSYHHGHDIATIGFVLQTLSGNEIYKGSESTDAHTSMEAEAQAINRAIEVAREFNPRHVEVHTDCDPLQRKLIDDTQPAKQLYRTIRSKMNEFTHSKIQDIPRTDNRTADDLASTALQREKDKLIAAD